MKKLKYLLNNTRLLSQKPTVPMNENNKKSEFLIKKPINCN